eukprot:11399581-Ditylum_brightwellii.AAC.1
MNKVVKTFQLQGKGNHPLVVATYVSFLAANSEIWHSNKLSSELNDIEDEVKSLSSDVKAAKTASFSATAKADK